MTSPPLAVGQVVASSGGLRLCGPVPLGVDPLLPRHVVRVGDTLLVGGFYEPEGTHVERSSVVVVHLGRP